MRRVSTLVFFTVLVALTGCVPSLQPLYTDGDLSFDSALLGTWDGENSSDTWEFTKKDETEYKLVVTESNSSMSRGRKGEFVVHLVKVEGVVFLDLFPAEPNCPQNDFYLGHLIPVHTFIRIFQVEPTLKLACFSPGGWHEGKGWLEIYLEKNPTAIRHEQAGDRILLTAPPKELQKFLLAHLPEGFDEPEELKRQQ
jgi:hypothetical protein